MSLYHYITNLNKLLNNRLCYQGSQIVAIKYNSVVMTEENYSEEELRKHSSSADILIHPFFWNYKFCSIDNLLTSNNYEEISLGDNQKMVNCGKLLSEISLHEVLYKAYTLNHDDFKKVLNEINIDRNIYSNLMIKLNYNLPMNENYKALIERVFIDKKIIDFIFNKHCYFSAEQIENILTNIDFGNINDASCPIFSSTKYSIIDKLRYAKALICAYQYSIDNEKIIYYSVKNPKIYLALYLFQLDLEGGIVDLYYDVLAHFFYNKGANKIIVIDNDRLNKKLEKKYLILKDQFELC